MALSAAAERNLVALDPPTAVVDSHIHLYDPTRPGGIPWPEKSNAVLYRRSLPDTYEHLSRSHGVVGAIAVECSPWLIDNFWLHDVVEQNPLMLGFIGNLLPEAPEFAATLDRLNRSPFFLGIRYGNLWGRDPGTAAKDPQFIAGLRLLAQSGLVLETANPDVTLISAMVRISDQAPDLRIVLDHLPNAKLPADASARAEYDASLRELATRTRIFVKGSEILKEINGRVPLDAGSYKAALDQIWGLFGENRVFFGSDWPNSDSLANYDQTFSVAQQYIATRNVLAQREYFWRNSISVYRWTPRTAPQKALWNQRKAEGPAADTPSNP